MFAAGKYSCNGAKCALRVGCALDGFA
jgi:hypothetical protein